MKFLKQIKNNEEGATAIEYGLIAALIAIGLIIALQGVGTSLTGIFDKASDELDSAATPTTT